MCGRYVSPDESAMEREFNLVRTEWQFPASFNVAPTQLVPIVRQLDGERQGIRLRWGLIPFWANGVPPLVKGTKKPLSTINAKIENVKTGSAWREPWRRGRRCLVIAQGFYEWQLQADGKTKTPYYIHTNDQEIFAFAGLWDSSKKADGEIIESVTHIVVPANNVVAEIHNTKQRMPAILEKADREAWLTGTTDEAWEALVPYPDDLTVAWPVSTRVNSSKNDDASLVEPFYGTAEQ